MIATRRLDIPATRFEVPSLVLCAAPNWTAVIFFALFGAVHFSFAVMAFAHGRWEGHMSLIFGTIFLAAAVVVLLVRTEMAVLPAQRRLRLRTGWRRWYWERSVPFASVSAVRLTKGTRMDDPRYLVEVICADADIECPATRVPRQEALCLAMTMDVQLIKVSAEEATPARF